MSFVLLPNLKITAHVAGSSGEAGFSEGYEFAESWPNTLDTPDLSPTGSFVTADLTEGFEFAESWPNTLDTPDLSPTASFLTADFTDGFEDSEGWFFDLPNNSSVATFEFSGWPGTIENPLTSSDFATYNNSLTSSFEATGWDV